MNTIQIKDLPLITEVTGTEDLLISTANGVSKRVKVSSIGEKSILVEDSDYTVLDETIVYVSGVSTITLPLLPLNNRKVTITSINQLGGDDINVACGDSAAIINTNESLPYLISPYGSTTFNALITDDGSGSVIWVPTSDVTKKEVIKDYVALGSEEPVIQVGVESVIIVDGTKSIILPTSSLLAYEYRRLIVKCNNNDVSNIITISTEDESYIDGKEYIELFRYETIELMYYSGSWRIISRIVNDSENSGSQYINVNGSGSASENGTELVSAYAKAKLISPSEDNEIYIVLNPGTYAITLPTGLEVDSEYIHFVSATSGPDVITSGSGIKLLAHNIIFRGIEFGGAGLEIKIDYPNVTMTNCSGFVYKEPSGGENNVVFSGNVTNFNSSLNAFIQGFSGFDGTFENVHGIGRPIFIAESSTPGETFIRGIFINCRSTMGSYVASELSATFVDCQGGNNSFNGDCSGEFYNCVSDFGFQNITSGVMNRCTLTQSTFPEPTGDGRILHCIDINTPNDGEGEETSSVFGERVIILTGNDGSINSSYKLLDAYATAKTMSPTQASPVNILLAPGNWWVHQPLNLDTEYINIMSLTGKNDVWSNASGWNIMANNIIINGTSCKGGRLRICGDYPGVIIENYSGYLSGPADSAPINITSTIRNCNFGDYRIEATGIASMAGLFENITSSASSMFRLDGPGTSLSGRFVNCNMTGNGCFVAENISGTFVNCSGDYNTFVGKNISGTFNNCRGNSGSFSSNTFDGTITGTFINCIGGQSSFCPSNSGRDNNGKYYYCTAGSGSFGSFGTGSTFSGVASHCNCTGNGFGSASITGQFYSCSAESGFSTVTSGTLIGCSIKSGTFTEPTTTGRILYCVDQLTTGDSSLDEQVIDMKPGEYLSDIIKSITDSGYNKRYTINFYNHNKTINLSTFTEKIAVPRNVYINFVGDMELWPTDYTPGTVGISLAQEGEYDNKLMIGFTFSRDNEYSSVIKSGLPSTLKSVCFGFLDNQWDVVENYDVLVASPELHGLGPYGLGDGFVYVKGDPLLDVRNRKLYKKKDGIFLDVTPEFNNVDFSGFDLRFSYFLGSKNIGATFKGADNRWAYMSYSDNTSANFIGADNRYAVFDNTHNNLASFDYADNRFAVFSNSFSTGMLTGMSLAHANNMNANFENSTIPGTTFSGSNNENTNFSGANLSGSIWVDVASIKNANFIGTNLTGGQYLPDRINTKAKWIAECGASNVDATTLWIDGTSITA